VSAPRPVAGAAFARIGLLGNPSDGYAGQVIALAIRNFRTIATLRPTDRFSLGSAAEWDGTTLHEWIGRFDPRGRKDGVELQWAAIRRFAQHWPALLEIDPSDPRLRFELSYQPDIPRQVGLSGSSAIVIATLRALSSWFGVPIEPPKLAELALAVEADDLGIAAGPMDRVIQSYEGVMHLDFAPGWGPDRYHRLDPEQLPPLLVAWDPECGAPSGTVHADLRTRFRRGDRDVAEAMAALRSVVASGLDALTAGDTAKFRKLVDENFELRASVCEIAARDRQLVEIGRSCGAAVKFCGSGGAIVGVMEGVDDFPPIATAYAKAGFSTAPVEIALPAGFAKPPSAASRS
jgi:glucuronokinase